MLLVHKESGGQETTGEGKLNPTKIGIPSPEFSYPGAACSGIHRPTFLTPTPPIFTLFQYNGSQWGKGARERGW